MSCQHNYSLKVYPLPMYMASKVSKMLGTVNQDCLHTPSKGNQLITCLVLMKHNVT